MSWVWVGRRSVAVVASLVWLVGSLVPASHVHFTVSPSGWLEPVRTHQHVQPHHLAARGDAAFHDADHDHPSIDDDHDDGLIQTFDQQPLLQDSGVQVPILEVSSFEPPLVAPVRDERSGYSPSPAAVLPSDPLLRPNALRAPPAAV